MIRGLLDAYPFLVFTPPYRELLPVDLSRRMAPPEAASREVPQGVAVLWSMAAGDPEAEWTLARHRPPGTSLLVMLPPAERLAEAPHLLERVDLCNPQSVLPYDPEPDIALLAATLRRPPLRLSIAFTDYLAWRGLWLDSDTRRLIQRTVDLSTELRSISGLSRALYVSRRALGRRFLARGLPVPSHWLHLGRLLHAVIRLQNTDDSLFRIAIDLGYPDGFALSNQMKRMVGVRPSTVRDCLGWEWVVECWLEQEYAAGGLRVPLRAAPVLELNPAPPACDSGQTLTVWRSSSSARFVADSGATNPTTSSAQDAEPGP